MILNKNEKEVISTLIELAEEDWNTFENKWNEKIEEPVDDHFDSLKEKILKG